MHYQVLSFDLDGTLVDTAEEIALSANRALADVGLPPQPLARVERCIGHGARQMMLRLLAELFLEQPSWVERVRVEQVLARLEHHYADCAGTCARPYPGALATLAQLNEHGVRVACLTNKEERFARRVLEAAGLSQALALLIGGDSLPQCKPSPQPLLHLIQRLGGEPYQAAHVGDSAVDVQTARAAGVTAWAVPWGYNGGEPVALAQPDRLFESLPAVAAHVLAGHRVHVATCPVV